jgi:hypothetical protein
MARDQINDHAAFRAKAGRKGQLVAVALARPAEDLGRRSAFELA